VVDLGRFVGHLKSHRVVLEVDDATTQGLGNIEDRAARAFFDRDLKQRQLALHALLLLQVVDLDDIDLFLKLPNALAKDEIVSLDKQRHARKTFLFAIARVDARDIEHSAAEEARQPVHRAGLVVNHGGDRVERGAHRETS
jgi:hypothetical protein